MPRQSAEVYEAQGQHTRAEPFYQRALSIRERALGPTHPGIASSLDNLARLYEAQGQYSQAEPLYQRALMLGSKRKTWPSSIATSLHKLAELYRAQQRYPEAAALHQRALSIREQAFGPRHLHVATSLTSLALLYADQGRYAQAEALYERATAVAEQVLGPDIRRWRYAHTQAEVIVSRGMGKPAGCTC